MQASDAKQLIDGLTAEVKALEQTAVQAMNSRIVLRVPLGLPETVQIPVPVVFNQTPYLTVPAAFTTDTKVVTYIKAIEYAIVLNGVYGADPSINASINLSPGITATMIELVARLRDTGSDREFSNTWVPMATLASGWIQGHRFGRGHIVLSPGAEVEVTVGVVYFNPAALTAIDISSIDVVVSLVGFTVPYNNPVIGG